MHSPRITDLGLEDLARLAAECGHRPFRARQVRGWILGRGVTDPAEMTDLPLSFREHLREHTHFDPPTGTWSRDPSSQTEKLLLNLRDGRSVEAVLIMEGRRTTVCLSSQVGCPVGCRFCASGLMGLDRNLTSGEIVDQFLAVRARARELDRRLSNVVMMGMGDPMLNLAAVLRALEDLNDSQGAGIGARRITISTVGLEKGLRRLAGVGRQYTLALSLHAPDDALRRELVPFPGALGVEALMRTARDWLRDTGREVTFEYVLLQGINDAPGQARALAGLLQGVRGSVNLIPYNENPGLPFRRPDPAAVRRFAAILRREGLQVSQRKQKGDAILAACGQLRLRATTP